MKKYFTLILLILTTSMVYADNWGSLYIDVNTGISGGSINYETSSIAGKIAFESCVNKHQKKGIKNNCKLVINVSNGCTAVYWSPINKKIGSAYGTFQNDTENLANRECAKAGGKNCQLSMSFCTDRIIY